MTESAVALARSLGESLKRHHWTVCTAESCTGGGIGSAITEIAGSSQWFEAGFVVYSNRIKAEVLGVPTDMLSQFGAVSEPVVRAMADGAIDRTDANLAVAVSGIAGPGGATEAKPVGTVCFAWGARNQLSSTTRHILGNRRAVREQTVCQALRYLIDYASGV